ncbi:hypothetical protein [Actinoallomurus rhizosphaericola]|uniref:hypothetical protein n=1 Tax=Actinoallomurus rhizosphaericola TaxID=2952536 RepID=UPI0020932D55|nr:hypothetical protein [Actinoallomurus rhizosphaericola]MCO5996968.1 hypothetical protein [Actinoallomurus rhizosphaericola]
MRIPKITAAAAVAGALVTAGVVVASPASAAPAQGTLTLRCNHPCSDPPGPGWRYIDNYYWASSCIEVGNRGINNRSWSKYQCYGSTWTNYDLWVI